MPDLEHVDVSERPLLEERLEHIALRVTRQQRREPLVAHEQYHARLVCRGVGDRLVRGHDRHRDPAHGEGVTRFQLADAVRAAEVPGGGQRVRRIGTDPFGKPNESDSDQPFQCRQPADVVRVQVRDDDFVERADTGPGDGRTQHCG